MAYGTLNAGTITPGSGNTLTISETLALGTVASGNLSNTAIVYPVGHVLQTVYNSYSGANACVTSGTLSKFSDGGAFNWKVQVTNVLASSHILVSFNFNAYLSKTTGTTVESSGGYGIHRQETPAATTYDALIVNNKDWSFHLQTTGSGATASVWGHVATICGMDTSPNTGTNTYYLCARAAVEGNQSVCVYSDNGDGATMRATAMEIKR
jgi:hypothetical protein